MFNPKDFESVEWKYQSATIPFGWSFDEEIKCTIGKSQISGYPGRTHMPTMLYLVGEIWYLNANAAAPEGEVSHGYRTYFCRRLETDPYRFVPVDDPDYESED